MDARGHGPRADPGRRCEHVFQVGFDGFQLKLESKPERPARHAQAGPTVDNPPIGLTRALAVPANAAGAARLWAIISVGPISPAQRLGCS